MIYYSTPIMKCGHSANAAASATGNPICVICIGINPGADEPLDPQPVLTDRRARCIYHDKPLVASSAKLPFFHYQPDKPFDEYYCGCRGWD